MKARPPFLKNYREIELPGPHKGATGEVFGTPAFFSQATGLSRLKILHLRLPPGTRTNAPGAYRDEEEFFFVLEGAPDLWIDGSLHALKEGDGVAFNDGTGIAHMIVNNTDEDVRLFVFGEATRLFSQFACPLSQDEATNEHLRKLGKLWVDLPKHKLGPNSGRPGDLAGRKRGRPAYVHNWRDIVEKDEGSYPNSRELHGIDAKFGKRTNFSRIGIHFEILPPGRRTSWPHCEGDEEEFVYVVAGQLDCWLDGRVHPMGEGDYIGWEAHTGLTHVCINNSAEDALILVGSEASRQKSRIWYPLHPHRDRETTTNFWHDHPKVKLGPHDGLPDAIRARLPAAVRKGRIKANRAVMKLKPQKR
jgi:uncharacterized cupin superfamily protein